MLGQDRVCAIASRRLQDAFGVAVEFGCAVTGLAQDADGVSATVQTDGGKKTIRAKYVVGADGGKGGARSCVLVPALLKL